MLTQMTFEEITDTPTCPYSPPLSDVDDFLSPSPYSAIPQVIFPQDVYTINTTFDRSLEVNKRACAPGNREVNIGWTETHRKFAEEGDFITDLEDLQCKVSPSLQKTLLILIH